MSNCTSDSYLNEKNAILMLNIIFQKVVRNQYKSNVLGISVIRSLFSLR